MKGNQIKIYENSKIRTLWDTDAEKWYISIADVIAVLTDSKQPRKYWSDLKSKLNKEGSELSEKIGQLKMKSSDGKSYTTDVANTEQLFRLIQSISKIRTKLRRSILFVANKTTNIKSPIGATC